MAIFLVFEKIASVFEKITITLQTFLKKMMFSRYGKSINTNLRATNLT